MQTINQLEIDRSFEWVVREHPQPLLLISPQTGSVLYASDQALLFYGWTMGELRQMTLADLHVSDDCSGYESYQAYKAWGKTDSPSVSFAVHRDRSGVLHPVRLTAFKLKNWESGLHGYLLCFLEEGNCICGAEAAGENSSLMAFTEVARTEPLTRREILQSGLYNALAEGQFYVAYQPFVDTLSRRIAGYEALVRWQHPQLGIIMPGELFSLQLSPPQLIALDFYVLSAVARRIGATEPHLMFHVNISARNFYSHEFVQRLSQFLDEHPLVWGRLVLDFDDAVSLLRETELQRLVEAHRVGIALENFGSKPIALMELIQVPLKSLNIDMGLIRSLEVSYADKVMVNAVLKISRSLGIEAIAKGVETGEQLRYLVRKGCRYLMGYVFSPPADEELPQLGEAEINRIIDNACPGDDPVLEETEKMVFEGVQRSYRAIFSESPLPMLLLSEDQEILDWNDKAEQLFGWTKAEVLGKHIQAVFSNLKSDDLNRVVQKTLQKNQFTTEVGEIITKDGSLVTCKWHNKILFDEKGKIESILCLAEDITAVVENDMLIQKLSVAMDLSGSVVIILDSESRVTNVNQKFELFTGLTFNEVLGKPVMDLELSASSIQPGSIQSLLDHHEVWRGELPLKNRQGQLIMCRAVVCPVQDRLSHNLSVVIILDDLSHERERDVQFMELKKLLSEQEKLATIGSMLTGIIHEINNPLSYIDTNMLALEATLREMNLPPSADLAELKDIVKDIKTGTQHIKEIAASLKRMAFKGFHEEEEFFDVNEEIETVLSVAKNEYKYYAVVNFQKEAGLTLTGYPSGIRQVILNLLINATYAVRKKYERGLGNIGVRSYRSEGYIVIEVTDDGIGIPEHIRDNIFESFFTTKKTGEGTGLGLSISKSIVEEKHGGSLTFVSVEGEGTTFMVRLRENNLQVKETQLDS